MVTLTAAQTEGAWFDAIFSNTVMLIIYAVPMLFFINMAVRGFMNRKNVRLPVNLGLVWGFYAGWLISLLLRFVVTDPNAVYVLTFLPYVFSTLSITFMLYFVLRFYNQGVFYNKSLILATQVIPFMTLVLIIIGLPVGFHEIRRLPPAGVNVPFISVAGANADQKLNFVYGEYGVWHHLVEVYCGLLVMVTLLVVLTQHFQLPKIYRDSSKRMIAAAVSMWAGFIINGFNIAAGKTGMGVVFPVHITLFGAMISMQFLYRASLGNQGLVFLSQARSDIINFLNQCILILDEEKNITYTNSKASEWMKNLNLEGDRSYLTLIDQLLRTATQCERLDDESGGSDFFFEDEDGAMKAFNLREKPIYDKRKHQIGTYVVYSDVTENRALIQRLEVGAGRDALTGLRNRGMMEHLKTELDKPESLPLSVIVCDLNDLKTTNDTYGHQQGDIMLRVAGEVIAELLPHVAQAGRMGGDEFLILLPQMSAQEASGLSKQINERLLKIDDYPYKITLAMGVGSKTDMAQELRDIIVNADEAMYRHKKEMKGSVRSKTSIA
jgi:diguanylate cyclase (GGDEF)-like protein